jgi:hypothetical protein
LVSYALEGRPLTTRGRSINPLVFAFHGVAAKLPQLRAVTKPIFILGSGRSGTTILGVVLSMHRDVGFLNEPKALWHVIEPHEDVVGNYTKAHARYRFGAEDATPSMASAARRMYGAYLLLAGARRVVDKYPELVFRVGLVRKLFPDARFLLLTRNGWDTAASIQQWSKAHGKRIDGEVHDWWGVNRRKWRLMCAELVPSEPLLAPWAARIEALGSELDMAAVEWIVTMSEGIRAMQKFPDDVKLVRLEDLQREPRRVLTEAAAFCELEHDDVFLEFGARTLRAGRPSARFCMDPAIRCAFDTVMSQLGY